MITLVQAAPQNVREISAAVFINTATTMMTHTPNVWITGGGVSYQVLSMHPSPSIEGVYRLRLAPATLINHPNESIFVVSIPNIHVPEQLTPISINQSISFNQLIEDELTSSSPANLFNDLLTYLPFQGDEFDYSGNNWGQAYNPSTVTFISGPNGDQAFEYDQTYSMHRFTIYQEPYLNVPYYTPELTVSFWFKPYDTFLGDYLTMIRYTDSNDQTVIKARNDNDNINVTHTFAGPTINQSISLNNEWYYLTYTYKNNVGKLYVNGNYLTNASGSIPVNSVYDITVGNFGEDGEAFSGAVSRHTVYTRALSDSEIEQLFNQNGDPFNGALYRKNRSVITFNQTIKTNLNFGTFNQSLSLISTIGYDKISLGDAAHYYTLASGNNDSRGSVDLESGGTYVSGPNGQAVYLQDMKVQAGASLTSFTDGLTVSCWVKNAPTIANDYFLELTNASGRFIMSLSGTYLYAGWLGNQGIDYSSSFNPGTFYYITFTYNPTTMFFKLYINGVQVNYANPISLLDITFTNLYVGGISLGGPNDNANATISNLVIYGRALSDAEVAQLYAQNGTI